MASEANVGGQGSAAVGAAAVIVAVGAPATRTSLLESLLAELPPQEGVAVVAVMQHRETLDDGAFTRALAASGRAVVPVEDGTPIEGQRLYLPPPNVVVTVDGDRFRLRPAEQAPGQRGTIDTFLVSLAEARDGRAIAVMLAGTGGDGTLGVKIVKEAGGLALAEESEEARAGDLALSNSPAALADAILPLDQLPARIARYAGDLVRGGEPATGAQEAEPGDALRIIAAILRNKTGHDFHGYKRGTFLRRVQRRMQVAQVESLQDYVEVLRAQPDEAQQLFNDLLIGVTQFFRDAKEFEFMEREVIPALFAGKGRGDQVRVWVIGCSTGEEAYSIAILLREHMSGLDEPPHVQIFATDIDGRALAAARAGRYAADIAGAMSPERLGRWFVKEGNTYCVVKELREMCIFSQHSIIKDAPFSRLDLVSCRNLLIYLETELQSRVIPVFHFALRPDGFLFLGNSENASRHTHLFGPIENRYRIFRRLNTSARVLPDFPFTAIDRRIIDAASPPVRPRALAGTLALRAERLAERYAPAYIVADEAFNVLHFSGRTGRYIDPAGGAATLNLLSLVHPDLRLDLRVALTRAAEDRRTAQVSNVRMGANGTARLVDLLVEPIQEGSESPVNFFVLFKDGAAAPDADGPMPSMIQDGHAQRLEEELRTTKDRLQATIEELESTNEELKSSNEEYQSLNEELQSANEELETSKEELQSVNEELTTVNGELAHRVQELARANSDLKNLLESTQIATIFLDNQLRVTNYTPAVAELFHLVETDLGRPIGHIKARIDYEELQDDVRRVLRTLASVDREVADPATGARYIARVLPYRTVDNFIGGVVVTFADVTPLTRTQQALRESERQAKLLLAELQHRVRNTLGVIRSIVRRTADTSDTVQDYAMHLEGRVDAFARVQAALTRDPIAGVDLEQLVAGELLAHAAQEGEQVASLRGPGVRLQPKAAETFGLAIHELATNSVKYGALASRQGRVEVGWEVEDGDGSPRLVFHWTETGPPPEEQPATRRRGFGTELIERTLAYELQAQASLGFEKGGLRCRIALPLTPSVAVLPGAALEATATGETALPDGASRRGAPAP